MAAMMCGEDGETSVGGLASEESGERPRSGAKWRVLTESVQGFGHQKSGTPNQDAIGSDALEEGGFVVCASDGHGSARYFRSEIGSRLAVETGIAKLRAFVDRCGEEDREGERWARLADTEARDRLTRDIVRAWRGACLAHAAENPHAIGDIDVSPANKASSEVSPDGEAIDPILSDDALLEPYGATFLAVVACPRFVMYMQLGDGDILVVEGGSTNYSLPRDARLMANETTSLCSSEAWKEFRVRLDLFRGGRPDLILMATDGYSNSFADDQDFLQVAGDLWAALCDQGVDYVKSNLADWLSESSHLGSGDDVSLGLLFLPPSKVQQTTAEDLADAIEGEL